MHGEPLLLLRQLMVVAAFSAAVALSPIQSPVEEVTGTLGEPSTTTTITGKQLPPPDPKFGGVIKEDALQSKPWWAPQVVLPKGAPNV
jgi:hypothetical protein